MVSFDARLKLVKITSREMRWFTTGIEKCEACQEELNGQVWYFLQRRIFLCDNCKRKFQAQGTGAEPFRGRFRQDFLPVDVVSQEYFEKLRDAHEIELGGEEDAPE